MSISGISSSGAMQQQWSAQQSAFQQTMQTLTQAIQSGDLAGAQKAYATLTQSMPGNGASSSSNTQNNPFAQALSQIGSALQSGDISSAQQALSTLQSQRPQRPDGGQMGPPPAPPANGSSQNSSTSISTTTLMSALPGSTDISA